MRASERLGQIKCNNVRPVCANCTTYEQECIYEPISDTAKVAGRARHLRSKNSRPRLGGASRKASSSSSQAAALTAAVSPATATAVSSSSTREDERESPRVDGGSEEDAPPRAGAAGSLKDASQEASRAPTAEEVRVARILVSANGVSSYHGRTSTLFEDSNPPDRPAGGDCRPRMSDDWVERGLVAEAVRQCQLEELNYREGKLDFDGVEPELGMHLLSLHWNRQHHSFLLTHRPAFMRDMACNGTYFSKLLLNAIYFGASKFSPRLEVRRDAGDVRTAGWRFRERVRELLGGSLDRSDVTTIQALLVMTNSLFALGDERSAAWLYSGLAFRMLIDLGMHVDLSTTGRFSDEDLEIRRRVFWGAFVVDKVQSLYQGRPVSLKENDALVPIKFLDSYEELEHWQPFAYSTAAGSDYPGSPAYSISTFTCLCRLSLVMSDILSCIYTERSFSQSPAELSTMLGRLQRRLCAWRSSLPAHVRFDPSRRPTTDAKAVPPPPPPPHVFSLHAMYHVLVILLHRPFVADGHLYSTSRSISVESFIKCASAASSIVLLLRAYHCAFSVQRAPYLISYATYVAATIHSRIAAKRGHESTAYSSLATCLAVFQINQETNPAVRKATLIVRSLMKKLGVVIDTIPGDALDMVVDQTGGGASGQAAESDDDLDNRGQEVALGAELESNVGRQHDGGDETAVAATRDGVVSSSPTSEWVDVDGIIQSFLQEGDATATRYAMMDANHHQLPPAASWSTTQRTPTAGLEEQQQQQDLGPGPSQYEPNTGIAPTSLPVPDTGYNNNNAAVASYAWQTNWRASNNEPGLLEDPLFGFNSASLGNMAFTGW
ncbi:hypothetical protein JDV02_010731 [Purpureocillium takamizusanense]|uniref:Xylanolytic transcriptional activator regulatory domain-containing protein n=1 Tax=Purpureocillium takamizusanense TaxID=2060973 RepID=A0A9Q8VGV4_9HYPO|nr:uncharacterized protein JDV02_010731 [Purpureocillium takamizusanense]UNI25023.1 hypothetical protein JDV02_010731 [Purpureocillium takamizusanense]